MKVEEIRQLKIKRLLYTVLLPLLSQSLYHYLLN
jgi:hypothetical protein